MKWSAVTTARKTPTKPGRDSTRSSLTGGVPADAPELACESGEASTPPAFLEAAGLVKSRGEAKRLIKEGALSVDGERCDDALAPLLAGEYVIKLGKSAF